MAGLRTQEGDDEEDWSKPLPEAAPVRSTLGDDEDWSKPLGAPQAPEHGPAPAFDSAGRVYVESKSGRLGTVAPDELPKLGPDMRLAPRARVEREMQRAENESTLGMLQTFGEGAAQGFTLGGYGAIAHAISPEYRARMEAREEDSPITAGVGNVAGSIVPMLLSGGTGALARGASLAPSALVGRAALGAGAATAEGLGGGIAARIAGGMVGGGLEGALSSGTQQIAKELPQFQTDPSEAGEHVLMASLHGGLLGAAIGGGASALGEAASGTGALLDGAISKATGGSLLSKEAMREFAYDSATKAAIGRTNIAAIRKADRLGGTAAIGKNLIEEGVVGTRPGPLGIPIGNDAAEILEKAIPAKQKYGQQLDDLVSQVDATGGAPDTQAIAQRIREKVVDPLMKSPSSRSRGKALESQFGDLLTELDAGEAGMFKSYADLRAERIRLDESVQAAFDSKTPHAKDIRRLRDAYETSFTDLADKQVGGDGAWSAAYDTAKEKYSHFHFAADQAAKAIQSQKSNRLLSPSDHAMALASGMAASDPLTGLAVGVGNKFLRERGRATVASVLHRFTDQAEQHTAVASIANEGAARLSEVANSLVQNVGRSKYGALGATMPAINEQVFADAISTSKELADPNSEASQELANTARQLDAINPGMGTAYAQAAQAQAQHIASKLPKAESAAVFAPAPSLDPIATRSLKRTVAAAQSPQKSFERLAAGTQTPEDVETLQKVYPALYKRFQQETAASLQQQKKPPNYNARLRISYATGLSVDPSMELKSLRTQQMVANMPDQQKAEEAKAEAKNKADAASFGGGKFRDADEVYAAPFDRIVDRR